ncbi:MAG: DUF2069 domain-containing protein [Burkholderiaceae bacterium]|nr:DUF2069 domain-containing protein [Burkholderiaceae bacterium]
MAAIMPVMSIDAAQPDAVVRATRALAVACLLGMVALGLAWELWLARTGSGTWAVKVLPLVWPLAGMLKLRLYTYRWVSLLVWLYIAEGLVRGPAGRGAEAALAWAQVALGLLLFAATAAHVRWRLSHARRSGVEVTA